jgi:hypothetical protein
MKKLAVAFVFLLGSTFGEHALLGQVAQPGVFYVSTYTASGTHTDYDMARQAADAYAVTNPWSGSILVLKPSINETCDAIPLPSLTMTGTTSIIGYGSATSSIVKAASCPAAAATLRHSDSPNGQLSRGLYQGFTVDANHIDLAACEMYGMSLTTFLDVSCGNAAADSDHELEFGNRDANSVGWMDNIYIYDLKTFDSVIGGAGAILSPVWNGESLSAVQVLNQGTKTYSQYARAQLIGPDLYSCSTVPTLTLTRGTNSLVNGAMVTAAGSCQSTKNIHILIQDGTPVGYGMKFSNMADSHVWNLQATGTTTYGEAWLIGSNNNSIYNETPSANQTTQIEDDANGNRHINTVFLNTGGYATGITSQNGTFQNPRFEWNTNSYVAASGYFFGNDPRVFQDWMIKNSQCSNSSSSSFIPITTRAGPILSDSSLPAGIKLRSIEACDGTQQMYWAPSAP